jgi:AbrB family looped-hinge helix DNA binding protein
MGKGSFLSPSFAIPHAIINAIYSGIHYGITRFMTTTLTVDKAGRVVLPKPVRDELQLSAGDSLELDSSEGQIVLRPVRGAAALRKKDGIWVLSTGKPLSAEAVNRTIQKIRDERERAIVGRFPTSKTKTKNGRTR